MSTAQTPSPTPQRIRYETSKYVVLRERILAQIPDLDAQTLADTLEGLSDLNEMIIEIVRSALEDEGLAYGLRTRLDDMRLRLDRIETRAKRKRQLVLDAMCEANLARLVAADFTASLRTGPPLLEIVAEEKIPTAFWKPQQAKLDRQGLLAALKCGAVVDGAGLTPPQIQLNVRTK